MAPSWIIPTLADIRAARDRMAPYLQPTPFYPNATLSEMLGCECYVKYENTQPIGAFKIRGGVNLIAQLSAEEKRCGVITASTGNHGQSIAYASRLFDVKACIAVPRRNNPSKNAAMRRLGADVIEHGHDYDEARDYAMALAAEKGFRYIDSANEPHLIEGVGTMGLEMHDAVPDLDLVFVAVGGGSGACGVSLAMKNQNSKLKTIGVQSEAAPAAYLSWKEKRIVKTDSHATFAEGIATRQGYEFTQRILRDWLDDFILVSERELRHAIRVFLDAAHQLAEGAGAAGLAGAIRLQEKIRGKKVAVILSGANLTLERLRAILGEP